jgi:hypothetical protein
VFAGAAHVFKGHNMPVPFHTGAEARLHFLSDQGEHRFALILARPPIEAAPASLLRRGELSVALPHDRGATWPDRSGEALARGVLDHGGAVALVFAGLGDAVACKARIDQDNRANAQGGRA